MLRETASKLWLVLGVSEPTMELFVPGLLRTLTCPSTVPRNKVPCVMGFSVMGFCVGFPHRYTNLALLKALVPGLIVRELKDILAEPKLASEITKEPLAFTRSTKPT